MFQSRLAGLFDFYVTVVETVEVPVEKIVGFNPVLRDYLISTNDALIGLIVGLLIMFQSRLAGLFDFYAFGDAGRTNSGEGFNPVLRDYLIST